MKWAIAIIITAFFFASTSCRRHEQPTPINPADTTIVIDTSDSKYDTAWLDFGFENSGALGTNLGANANAHFSPVDTNDTMVRAVFLNQDGLSLAPYYEYYHDWHNLTYNDCYKYRGGTWKIISNNGVTDMSYKMQPIPDFTDSVPHNISISSGFNFSFDPAKYSGADSITIYLNDGAAHEVTETTSVQPGSVIITPAQMSNMYWFGSFNAFMEITIVKNVVHKDHSRIFMIREYNMYQYDVTINQ